MNGNYVEKEPGGFSGNQLLMAFFGGALTGVAIALLTAPQSGSETRQTVRGWVGSARDRASRIPGALRTAGERAGSAAKEAGERAADAAKEAFTEARQRQDPTGQRPRAMGGGSGGA